MPARYAPLDDYVLMGCAVRTRDILAIWGQRAGVDDPLAPQPTTLFFFYPEDPPEERWAHRGPVDALNVYVCAASSPKQQWIAAFSDGDVWAIGGGDDGPEDAIVPAGHVYVRTLRSLGGIPHAVTASAIWRRESPGRWTRLDDGLRQDADLRDAACFEGDGAIYACGATGLWRHDGKTWTNVAVQEVAELDRVHCGSDGNVYAVRGATLHVGRHDSDWLRIDMPERIVASTPCGQGLLVASNGTLYDVQASRLAPSVIPSPPLDVITDIAFRDGVLLAIGSRQAAFFDGGRWRRFV